MKVSISYSGGMDSLILMHLFLTSPEYANADLSCIYWSHGHKQDAAEQHHLPGPVEVRRCDWLNLDVDGGLHGKADANAPIYIPGRNLAFAVLTACQELPDELWIGALANEQHALSTDKNAFFCYTSSVTISHALSPFLPSGVRVRCPLAERGFDKGKAAQWAVDTGMPVEMLAKTWSCRCDHHPGTNPALPCGNCDQCIRRFAIFTMLGKPDAERYASPILGPGEGRDWLLRLYRTAEAKGRESPEAADCAPFMNHLWRFLLAERSGDPDLVWLAALMAAREEQMNG
jgi:queuosine biosynthesis protein QueC